MNAIPDLTKLRTTAYDITSASPIQRPEYLRLVKAGRIEQVLPKPITNAEGHTTIGTTSNITYETAELFKRAMHLRQTWGHIRTYYTSDNWLQVFRYIDHSEALQAALIEAVPVLAEAFPNSRLELHLSTDLGYEGEDELFIYVHTSMDVMAALEQLTRVDNEWLVAASRRTGGAFNVNLRLQ